MQLMLLVLVIDHFAAVHQCLDACNEILGVLSWSGHHILKFSEVQLGVDVMCHSLLYSVKEGRSFHLGHSLFLFAASRHQLCMHLQGFGSQGCKDVLEVVLAVRHDAVKEEPVLQGLPKDGERVLCIFQVPVIDGQANGCCSSCQCASNGIGCGLGRLYDELLWGWFCGHVSDGQIRKDKGMWHKGGYISETVSLIEPKCSQNPLEDVSYTVEQWQWCQGHDDITTGTDDDAASQKLENIDIFMLILHKYGLRKGK